MNTRLTDLARSLTTGANPFAFCGIGARDVGGNQYHTATAPDICGDEHSFWRAASMSKLVTGWTAYRSLWAAGKLDQTVEDLLGYPLRAPDGSAPTPTQLTSHQAGITDAYAT